MATDLDTKNEPTAEEMPRPGLKITGLHIKGLKSIGSLDLPEDGLGWDGPMPDMLMIGGINGSGKTSLLEFLAAACEQFSRTLDFHDLRELPMELEATEAWIDLHLSIPGIIDERFRFVVGDKRFIDQNGIGTWFGFEYMPSLSTCGGRFRHGGQADNILKLESLLFRARVGEKYQSASVLYFSSERRLSIPDAKYRVVGRPPDKHRFVQRLCFRDEQLVSLWDHLHGLRWEDLNGKQAGLASETDRFDDYKVAFNRFFQGKKNLGWSSRGELVVETGSGVSHHLVELSSGEKQVILFMGELLNRWRPGSLILIDEPELHLHESYQTILWDALVDWQKERGGQVIVATQSGHLYRIASSSIKVLLSARRAR